MKLNMEKTQALISFVGMRDPYPPDEDEPGPLLALLIAQHFDQAWLLCNGAAMLERARDLEREAREEGVLTRFHPVDFPLKDVIDYAEIWERLQKSLNAIKEEAAAPELACARGEWSFLLDSGTPQMKTCLLLASRTGIFPATLIQGVPPRFAGGTYKARRVRLDGLPCMEAPPPKADSEPITVLYMTAEIEPDEATASAQAPGPVARGPLFKDALERASRAARFDEPVLLLGETGSGKTLLARRIHDLSRRKGGPFIEVNCSAIPEAMAESELFGHLRGSFTGAEKERSGKFRAAAGGTLFLDEVGDLCAEVQAKLLKALDERAICPVGADSPIKVDTRVVAATNRDLSALVRAGSFRQDLYERLKVVVISLPPLRDRREDIPGLADNFISEWNEQYLEERSLSSEALEALQAWAWPGNVRELRNAIRSAAATSLEDLIELEAFPEEIQSGHGNMPCERGQESVLPAGGINLPAKLLQVEWDYVSAALRRSHGNREAAAKLLGMTGHTLRKALKERLAGFLESEEGEG